VRVLDHDRLQCPPQPAARELRSWLGGTAGVLLCGGYLLFADREPQSPRQWEQRFSTIRAALERQLIVAGTLDQRDESAGATVRLNWLLSVDRHLPLLRELGQIACQLRDALAGQGVLAVLTNVELWLTLQYAAALAQHRAEAAQHEDYYTQLLGWWAAAMSAPDAAGELKGVSIALDKRDIDAFQSAAADVETPGE
jgi:hypothetical protein